MSVAAVKIDKHKITIGADSIVVRGWHQNKDENAKIIKVNDMVLAYSGRLGDFGIMKIYATTTKPATSDETAVLEWTSGFFDYYKKKTNKWLSEYFCCLMVYEKKAFLIESLHIEEIEDFWAIGAGMEYASAALHLGHSVKEALEVACELSTYCEKPIKIYEVKK